MLRAFLHHSLFTLVTLFSFIDAEAKELTEKLSLNGVLSGALQCQQLSDETVGEDTCKTGVPLQPELTYRVSKHDSLFLKLGFAAGNGLNEVSPFNLSAWGADLHDDVINVSGSGRDYLLTAWYQHVFELDHGHSVDLTLGLIDASTYLDQNVYANDEYNQFMNPALSNAPNTFFLPMTWALLLYGTGINGLFRARSWRFIN